MASPRIRVLYAIMERLNAAGLPALSGIPDLKLRWARNRYTTREERPCLALAFVSDEPAEGDNNTNTDELVRSMAFDIIIDLAIETEASAEANLAVATPIDAFDPSGLANLSWVLDLAMFSLRQVCVDEFGLRDTTPLGRMVDWIEDVSIDDDEELQDDDGRLVGRANVIYRTSSWDPRVLFERAI